MTRRNREWAPCSAGALAASCGEALIGRSLLTQKVGAWPGGVATVARLNPDAKEDNIAFFVTAAFWPPEDEPDEDPEMGVFRNETVILYPVRPLKARGAA